MIVISSGHGLHVPGAIGPEPWGLNEVEEARRVVAAVTELMLDNGEEVEQLHDNVSHTQEENLKWIVSHHNAFPAEGRLDVSVHFNAYMPIEGACGTECFYVSRDDLAGNVSAAIAGASGLINRGSKYSSDLYFLNKTNGSLGAILIEVAFVDAKQDVIAYDQHFDDIIKALANLVPKEDQAPIAFKAIGKVSWFGGPQDDGVSSSENLAWWDELDEALEDAPELFLDYQPEGTTGLARRLDPDASYIAMRWDYNQFSKQELASGDLMFNVRALSTGEEFEARPADWGPSSDAGTGGRVADISPSLLARLGIETDDEVEITLAA